MTTQIRSASKMVDIFKVDPQLRSKLKDPDPIPVLQEAAVRAESSVPYRYDKLLYRIAICVLGLLALLAGIGSIVITMSGRAQVPDVLVALGSAAVGALVGLFAPAPSN